MKLIELKEYRGLSGAGVVGTPAFKDNLLSFGVCYGLALQGLKQASLSTNLIPPEIIKDRLWRAKKPWAVATVAAILLGCAGMYFSGWRAYASAREDQEMKAALDTAQRVVGSSGESKSQWEKSKSDFESVNEVARRLASINDRRMLWPELLAAVSQCVPQDKKGFKLTADNPKGLKPEELEKELAALVPQGERIYIDSFDCEYTPKVEDWFTDVRTAWGDSAGGETASTAPANPMPPADPNAATTPTAGATGQAPAAPAPAPAPDGAPAPTPTGDAASTTPGPSGEGWVIQIIGHHFHNQTRPTGDEYIRETLLKKLLNKDDPKKGTLISLPGPDGKSTQVSIKDLGISYPVLLNYGQHKTPYQADIPLPGWNPGNGAEAPSISVNRYDFAIQFCWKERSLSKVKPAEAEKSPALASGADNATAPKPN